MRRVRLAAAAVAALALAASLTAAPAQAQVPPLARVPAGSTPPSPSFRAVFVPKTHVHLTNAECPAHTWIWRKAHVALVLRTARSWDIDIETRRPGHAWSRPTRISVNEGLLDFGANPVGTFYDDVRPTKPGTYAFRIRFVTPSGGPVVDGDPTDPILVGAWSSVHKVKVTKAKLRKVKRGTADGYDYCVP
jgi:hypothetical protein